MITKSEDITEKIETILAEVRPGLQAHGGGVRLVRVDAEGNVTLKIEGACQGCPLSFLTFGSGVEKMIQEHVPGVGRISYDQNI